MQCFCRQVFHDVLHFFSQKCKIISYFRYVSARPRACHCCASWYMSVKDFLFSISRFTANALTRHLSYVRNLLANLNNFALQTSRVHRLGRSSKHLSRTPARFLPEIRLSKKQYLVNIEGMLLEHHRKKHWAICVQPLKLHYRLKNWINNVRLPLWSAEYITIYNQRSIFHKELTNKLVWAMSLTLTK